MIFTFDPWPSPRPYPTSQQIASMYDSQCSLSELAQGRVIDHEPAEQKSNEDLVWDSRGYDQDKRNEERAESWRIRFKLFAPHIFDRTPIEALCLPEEVEGDEK